MPIEDHTHTHHTRSMAIIQVNLRWPATSVKNWWTLLVQFYCPYALDDGSQRIRIREKTLEVSSAELSTLSLSVVKLLSKRWWIPIGTRLEGSRLEGSKLEPEGPRAEMGFSTTDQGFQHSGHSV